MAFFIPYSIQKRLLRYALSRLELLDTDALNLDTLEIGWGKRSTVELQNVGLRKDKITALLKLPDWLSLERATVGRLRLTVPANLHTSSVVVEISNVEARVRLYDEEEVRAEGKGRSGQNPSRRRSSRKPGREEEPQDLPDPEDLAKSFLQEETPHERAQLEAALNAQSIDLSASVGSSDAGSGSDPSGSGVGAGFGLPTFLATFLKGIGDRLQVSTNNITINLDFLLDIPGEDGVRSSGPKPTTICFHVDDLCIGDVHASADETESSNVSEAKPQHAGENLHSTLSKRRVTLNGVRGQLICEPVVFSQLFEQPNVATRFPAQPGPNVSSVRAVHAPGPTSSDQLDSSGSSMDYSGLSGTHHTSREVSESHTGAASVPDDDFTASLPFKPSFEEEEDLLTRSSTVAGFWSTEDNEDEEIQPSESRSQQLHDSLTRFREERASLHKERLSPTFRARRVASPPDGRKLPARTPTPPPRDMPGTFQTHPITGPAEIDDRAEALPSISRYSHADEIETPLNEDLAQSQYFSHEEAESIYMSALHESTTFPDPPRMPGHWQDNEDIDESPSGEIVPGSSSTDKRGAQSVDGQASVRYSAKDEESRPSRPAGSNGPSSSDHSDEVPSSSFISHGALVRTFLGIDTVAMTISQRSPDTDTSDHGVVPPTPSRPSSTSTSRRSVPGSFSCYAESTASLKGSIKAPSTRDEAVGVDNGMSSSDQPTIAFDVEAAPANVQIEMSTFRVLHYLLYKLQAIINAVDTDTTRRKSRAPMHAAAEAKAARSSLQIRLAELAIAFSDPAAESSSIKGDRNAHTSSDRDEQSRTLATLRLKDLYFGTTSVEAMTDLRLEFGNVVLGLGGTTILSFSQSRSLRTSIDDLGEESDADASITLSKRGRGSEIHIWTRPLDVSLDLFKLDNILESIGGLSGLLELGSSVMSDSTIITRSVARPKSKGVHFEASTKMPEDEPKSAEVKVNIKLGGVTINILGQSCSINAQCSPIAAVSRAGGVRARVGDIVIRGPHLMGVKEEAACQVIARDARLNYLHLPEEADLQRLIKLMNPSNDRFEEEDDFLVDTLLRQRKKGAVLRLEVTSANISCDDLSSLDHLQKFAQDMSRLSAVTKYLPQETRPGLLTLASVNSMTSSIVTGTPLGDVILSLGHIEVAHISAPALIAASVGSTSLFWDKQQTFIRELNPVVSQTAGFPMLMARMIEDQLEPNVKVKVCNACIEYTVPFLVACTMAADELSAIDGVRAYDSGASISTGEASKESQRLNESNASSKPEPLRLDVALRDCAIGLNPAGLRSKGLLMLNDASMAGKWPHNKETPIEIALRKAEILIIDDVSRLGSSSSSPGRSSSTATTPVSRNLCRQGYVNVCSVSAASFSVSTFQSAHAAGDQSSIDINIRDELLLLETCADSTQTLGEIFGGLSAPAGPKQGGKYRTEVTPVEDLMASFLGDAFVVPEKKTQPEMPDEDVFAPSDEDEFPDEGLNDDDLESYDESSTAGDDLRSDMGDDALEESIYGGFDFDDLADSAHGDQPLREEHVTGTIAATPAQMTESILGSLHVAQLPPQIHAKAKRFDSRKNRYVPVTAAETTTCPIKVHAHDMHIIWNMYDGYDWEHTRDVITQAVQDVETRAEEKRKSRRAAVDKVEDDESVIGDCLFNSVYIGVPVKGDPKDLARQINHDIDDLISETASRTAPSNTSTATSRPGSSHRPWTPHRKLKLDRSKRHKIAFELRGVSADFYTFPPGGETQSSTDICVRDFEIFDHVPTSTWKKFLTYMHDAGPREDKKPMVHLEICDVRPVAELTASELVVRATVLPLRLHVDQDALDFITRFFGFKDDSKPPSVNQSEQPFLQRIEIPSIPVKLDYKPKKVDYAAIRSGRTKEFMNFMILDGSDFILKHVCLYGVSGFDKMHEMLEDIWMADVKSPQQLPGVLSGLNGVRTLVNVGTGMRDLVQIPIREYKKDGRIVRSISKGALAFGRTTGGELTRFGAKLAIGAQRALQGAEGVFLGPGPNSRHDQGWEEADLDEEEKRAFSHYANQPIGILQGLKGAARSLERDLLVTRDVVIAISGEVRESGSVESAARAIARHAPTLILRPMIGASKAVGQTMMGATNTVDPANRRRMEDKYKRY